LVVALGVLNVVQDGQHERGVFGLGFDTTDQQSATAKRGQKGR
jgi:hypothetical protein